MNDILDEIRTNKELKIPVDFTINNINVDVILLFHHIEYFEILILNSLLKKCKCNSDIHVMFFKNVNIHFDIHYMTPENLEYCLLECKQVLKNISIDTTNKRPFFIDTKKQIFQTYFSEFEHPSRLFCSTNNTNNNYYLNSNYVNHEEPCSVCYENTYQKTACNHPLCTECRIHILTINKMNQCPICRDAHLNCIQKKCQRCIYKINNL